MSMRLNTTMMVEMGPKSYGAAMHSECAAHWREAIGKEKQSIVTHDVFNYVGEVPEGETLLDSKCILRRKHKPDGPTDKWKARLVARDDHQQAGKDYFGITAPVIDSHTVRLGLGLAAKYDMGIAVMDIPTAFLGCDLYKTIYD